MSNEPGTEQDGLGIIARLRNEPFNRQTEERLASHPFLLSAEAGTLTLPQRRAFACEQFAVQRSDAISFASLAGHRRFVPKSLTDVAVPNPIPRAFKADATTDLFQFLLGGEVYAAPLLLSHARSLGLDEAMLSSHASSALAQAYPSYWSRIALAGQRAAGAAACAVNFPAWGEMCRKLGKALAAKEKGYGYSGEDDDGLAFLNFFASPIENLDEMAASIIEEENACYEDLVEPVRLLQEYEVLFWDAVFAAE